MATSFWLIRRAQPWPVTGPTSVPLTASYQGKCCEQPSVCLSVCLSACLYGYMIRWMETKYFVIQFDKKKINKPQYF